MTSAIKWILIVTMAYIGAAEIKQGKMVKPSIPSLVKEQFSKPQPAVPRNQTEQLELFEKMYSNLTLNGTTLRDHIYFHGHKMSYKAIHMGVKYKFEFQMLSVVGFWALSVVWVGLIAYGYWIKKEDIQSAIKSEADLKANQLKEQKMRKKGTMPGSWNNCGLNHDTFEIKEMYHGVVEEIFGKANSRKARSERMENSRFHRSFSSLGKVPMNTTLNSQKSDNTLF